MDAKPAQPHFQLRIDFDGTPTRQTELRLELRGARVHVEILSGLPADVWGYLSAAGISARIEENSPILFGITDLPKLADLPTQVRVRPATSISALYQLSTSPPIPGVPATVRQTPSGLDLNWFDGEVDRAVPLPVDAVPAFLILGVPFVATLDAWDLLLASSELPPRVGTARINLDGFCEIAAITPQLVESAPLPGLFRLGPTSFGLPLRYVSHLEDLRGFVWEGRTPPPPPKIGPVELGLPLRPHLRDHIPSVAAALSADGGHLMAWSSGLGRRLAAHGVLETLDAYPAIVVCPPWRVWLWMRQFAELGRSVTLGTRTGSEVSIITYHDLSISSDPLSPVAILLDSPDCAEGRAAYGSLRSLVTTYPDAYRLGMVSELPPDAGDLSRILDLLRPGEFDIPGSLYLRYPGDAHLQFTAHASCYYTALTADDVPPVETTPGSDPIRELSSTLGTVEVCQPSPQLTAELERIRSDTSSSLRDRLAHSLEAVSVGTPDSPSPKLARALSFARDSLAAGHKAAVLCAHPRAMALLRLALAPTPVEIAEGAGGPATTARLLSRPDPAVLLVHHPTTSVDLSGFDDVLVYDYPWNMAEIDAMIGTSALTGPKTLRILHLTDSPDDRLALAASRRRTRSLTDPAASGPPSDDADIAYLLAPRYRPA